MSAATVTPSKRVFNEARIEVVRARIAASGGEDVRTRALLVLVHELLRRETDSPAEPSAALSSFDAARWPAGMAERLGVYAGVVERVWAVVAATVPSGDRVLVVSRGDERLVELPGVVAAHFPQDPRGGWAGHYPADGAAALAHLQDLRGRGHSWLVVPASGFWWLDYYDELAAFLRPRVVHADDDLAIYDLRPDGDVRGAKT